MNYNENNKYGLKERDISTISGIFSKYGEVRKAVLFGSRAKGSHHLGSDIDIAIIDENVPYKTLRKIKSEFEDSPLPYNVDLVNFNTLTNNDLKEHISRVGEKFYTALKK
ncbi:MAG: nucleotidyltransferase domain-containing protein [Prevotellaceae bacterium]|jgi:predicted nucleotidyltransferase|nr:nucleotidyltransferase domain-containing protein [Prevotellaceae bacterium]